MNIIHSYKNGNVITSIFDNGTKIRFTKDDEFNFDFAENIDVKICDYCDANCAYCHEGSSKKGSFGDILNEKFFDTLHSYQEIAIGGGDATSHPDLIPFLKKLKEMKVIVNMTVNQIHFEKKQDLISYLVDNNLIYGIGISLANPTNDFIELVRKYSNAVIHVINGIVTRNQIEKLLNNNLKLLILGYKDLRRGHDYKNTCFDTIKENQKWLYNNIERLRDYFNVISFDNLAIEQLNVKRFVTNSEWNYLYMGDEGTSTFYIDTVLRQFAESSTAKANDRYSLKDSVDEMFKIVKKSKSNS